MWRFRAKKWTCTWTKCKEIWIMLRIKTNRCWCETEKFCAASTLYVAHNHKHYFIIRSSRVGFIDKRHHFITIELLDLLMIIIITNKHLEEPTFWFWSCLFRREFFLYFTSIFLPYKLFSNTTQSVIIETMIIRMNYSLLLSFFA